MFHPDTKSVGIGMLISLGLVVAVALLGTFAHADGPSRADLQHLAAIQKNQKTIADTRANHNTVVAYAMSGSQINSEAIPDYNQFVLAKQDNASNVEKLGKDGWCVNWNTLALQPCSSFQSRPL